MCSFCNKKHAGLLRDFSPQKEYLDKREILVRALIAGEKSGKSDLTIEDIWTSVKARRCTDKYEN